MEKSQFSRTGNSIYNDEIRTYIGGLIQSWFTDEKQFSEMVDIPRYVHEYRHWIQSTKLCTVKGLEDYQVGCVSLGVTQALDEFHYEILRQGRRLRLFKGEYPYNRDVHDFDYETGYIDDYPLLASDAVVLSCPFSATGDIHPLMNQTLDQCWKLKIPVFIDAAWFGTCGGLDFDFSHPGISHLAFSLTKGLTVGNYRSGVRWSRSKDDLAKKDRLYLHQHWNHSIHLNLKIGLELMKRFSPDTQFNKYRDVQLEICKEHNLVASPCVHVATSQDARWREFNRDGITNRLNLREAVKAKMRKKPI